MKKRGKFRYKAKPTLEFLMACSLVAIVVIIAISILSYVGVLDREIIKQQKIEDALIDGNAPLLKKISVGISAITGAVVGATGYIASNPILALLLIFTSITAGVKAQASMEFLMAYGWAIMVLLIAIGTLAYFGVLSPARFMPQKCILEAGVACTDSEVNEDSVTFVLENVKGEGISISEIAVSNCTGTNFGSFFLKNGGKGTFTVSGCNNIANEKFVEKINLTYIGESGLTHKKGGSMVGMVKGGTGAPPSELGRAECGDGDDNDGDGQVDLSDTGCSEPNDDDETDCGDGVCEGGETPASCSADCAAVTMFANAFTGGDTTLGYPEIIQQTSDEGYIVAGWTDNFGAGNWDALVLKLDSSGNQVWVKTFGGINMEDTSAVLQISDGSYIVLSDSKSYGAGNSDALILKLDSSGNQIWAKTVGESFQDHPTSIQQTSDGDYIITGYTTSFGVVDSDAYVTKLDSNGDHVWTKTYGGDLGDWFLFIQQTSDGGYIATGGTDTPAFSAGEDDFLIVKLDSTGNAVWARTFGGVDDDYSSNIKQTSDGGYVVVGYTYSFGAGSQDALILKLDASGNLIWAKTYGGSQDDRIYSIQQISDGYIAMGYTASYGAGSNDALVLKLDSNGDVVWAKVFGGGSFDTASEIKQTSDGGYVIAGGTYSFGTGILVIKLDSDGSSGICSALQDIPIAAVSQAPSTASPTLTISSQIPQTLSVTPIASPQTLTTVNICPE